ncbi:MAG: DNA-binding protein [Rhodoferax sp.]
MSKTTQLKTREQVLADFKAAGITQTEWARANGFNRLTLVGLLRGAHLGRWGESHRCAVALGLKEGVVVDVAKFKPAPQRRDHERRAGAAA